MYCTFYNINKTNVILTKLIMQKKAFAITVCNIHVLEKKNNEDSNETVILT